MNNFWKGSRWFCRQYLRGAFVTSYDQNQENGCLENYICVRAFEHRPRSPNWPSVLHSLYALPVAVLAIPTNSAAWANHVKSAKHIVDYFSHVFFQTCKHLHQLTHMRRCVLKPFVQRNGLTSSNKFTFDFLKIAENFWFLIFCTNNKQWCIAR